MDLGAMINGIADSLSANNGAAMILDSPIYTALLITLIILMAYRFGSEDTSNAKRAFYIFALVAAALFLYHRRFMKKQEAQSRIGSAIFAVSSDSHDGIDTVDIQPMAIPAVYAMTP